MNPPINPAETVEACLGEFGFTAEFQPAKADWDKDRLRVRADIGAWLWAVNELTQAEGQRCEANLVLMLDELDGSGRMLDGTESFEDDVSRLYGRTADYILASRFAFGTSDKMNSPACLVRRAMLGRHERFGDMETVEFGRSVLDGHDETEMIPVIVALAEGLHDDGGHFNAEALNLFKPGPTDG